MEKLKQLRWRPTKDLVPYQNNARTHSDAQIDQVVASIQEFGWTNPILIDAENGIIAGHARVEAAKRLGMEKVPCLPIEHLTGAQRRAYIIADNKLAENAGWDQALLGLELSELGDLDFNLELTGFDLDEIGALIAAQEATEGHEGNGVDNAGNLSDRFGAHLLAFWTLGKVGGKTASGRGYPWGYKASSAEGPRLGGAMPLDRQALEGH